MTTGRFSVKSCALGLLAIGIVAIAAYISVYFTYPQFACPTAGNFNRGQNGLWLGSKWYHGKVTDMEVAALAKLLKREQIKYAYFHCRDINRNGDLRYPSFKTGSKFVQTLHKEYPDLKVIAWLGAVNIHTGGEVDISIPKIREHMATAAESLVTNCGFD